MPYDATWTPRYEEGSKIRFGLYEYIIEQIERMNISSTNGPSTDFVYTLINLSTNNRNRVTESSLDTATLLPKYHIGDMVYYLVNNTPHIISAYNIEGNQISYRFFSSEAGSWVKESLLSQLYPTDIYSPLKQDGHLGYDGISLADTINNLTISVRNIDNSIKNNQINNNKTNMETLNLLTLANQANLKEPEKTLRALGFTNDKNELTHEGSVLFLQFMLAKYQDEFVKEVVNPIKEYKEKIEKDTK